MPACNLPRLSSLSLPPYLLRLLLSFSLATTSLYQECNFPAVDLTCRHGTFFRPLDFALRDGNRIFPFCEDL